MKGDKREKIGVYPWVGVYQAAKAKTTILSAHSAAEILEFYRKHFAAKGWIETEDSQKTPAPDYNAPWYGHIYVHSTYYFERTRLGSKEYLNFTIRRHKKPDEEGSSGEAESRVMFTIHGDYLWDKPSQFPSWLAGKLFGPYAMVFVMPSSPCGWVLILL